MAKMMGSYPRHHRNWLAGPPIPSPRQIARMAPIPPAIHALTPRPLTSARREVWTHLGKFHA
eukprot:7289065-Heterocapsa_arctica.AAC.1